MAPNPNEDASADTLQGILGLYNNKMVGFDNSDLILENADCWSGPQVHEHLDVNSSLGGWLISDI